MQGFKARKRFLKFLNAGMICSIAEFNFKII